MTTPVYFHLQPSRINPCIRPNSQWRCVGIASVMRLRLGRTSVRLLLHLSQFDSHWMHPALLRSRRNEILYSHFIHLKVNGRRPIIIQSRQGNCGTNWKHFLMKSVQFRGRRNFPGFTKWNVSINIHSPSLWGL